MYTNWTRSALQAVIEHEGLTGGTVMLPAFICQDSFLPLFDRCEITPVFVDIRLPSYHMSLEGARERIDEVDAVLFVHSFGLPAEMAEWVELANEHGVTLIEDCARALSARTGGDPVGSAGTYAVYSLKKVAPVSKGAVLVLPEGDEAPSLERATYDVDAWYNLFPESVRELLSVVYPLDVEKRHLDAVTRGTFERYAARQYREDEADRRTKAERLREALEPLGFEFQPQRVGRVYPLVPAMAPDRDALAHFLNSYHVPHKTLWANPWGKTYAGDEFEERFPNSAALADSVLQFDIQNMDDEDVEFAIDRVGEFVEKFG
jgi:dTDP-4-amino-4,6-dideoxygalactose transaminase